MIEGKTASLFRWALCAGGPRGRAGRGHCALLEGYGGALGVAFQVDGRRARPRGRPQRAGQGGSSPTCARASSRTLLMVAIERDPGLRDLLVEALAAGDGGTARAPPHRAVSAALRSTGAADERRALATAAVAALEALAGHLRRAPLRDGARRPRRRARVSDGGSEEVTTMIITLKPGADVDAARRALVASGSWVQRSRDAPGVDRDHGSSPWPSHHLEPYSARARVTSCSRSRGCRSVERAARARTRGSTPRGRGGRRGERARAAWARAAPVLMCGPCAVESEAQVRVHRARWCRRWARTSSAAGRTSRARRPTRSRATAKTPCAGCAARPTATGSGW